MSPGGAFRVLIAELATIGLDPAAVCAGAGVDPAVITDPGKPFGRKALARVLARAEGVTGDRHLGLHLAASAHGRGVLAYVFRAQRTIGQGLEELARFAATAWQRPDAIRVARGSRGVTVTFNAADDLPRHALEFLVARTAIALRRNRATAREVWFRHAAAEPQGEYERVLGAPVRFGRASTALLLDPALLDRPLPTANAEAAAALTAGLARATLPARPASTAARVASALEAALARDARIDREGIARRLGMSGKTLARRLAAEQCGFRELVESARRTLAHRLVVEDGMPLGEVASRVGFADQAAFGKAFRRWFGASATTVRQRRRSG